MKGRSVLLGTIALSATGWTGLLCAGGVASLSLAPQPAYSQFLPPTPVCEGTCGEPHTESTGHFFTKYSWACSVVGNSQELNFMEVVATTCDNGTYRFCVEHLVSPYTCTAPVTYTCPSSTCEL